MTAANLEYSYLSAQHFNEPLQRGADAAEAAIRAAEDQRRVRIGVADQVKKILGWGRAAEGNGVGCA